MAKSQQKSSGAKSKSSEAPSTQSAGLTLARTTGGICEAEEAEVGEFDVWNEDTSKALGRFASAAAPNAGDAATLSAGLTIPVAGTVFSGVSLRFTVDLDAENEGDSFTVSGQLAAIAKGSVGTRAANLFVEAGLASLAFEATAGDAAECFDLLRWQMCEALWSLDDQDADTLVTDAFDLQHTLDTVSDLSAGDRVETAGDVFNSLSIGGKGAGLSGEATLTESDGRVTGRDEDGTFYDHAFANVSFDTKVEVEGVTVSIHGRKQWEEGVGETHTGEIGAEFDSKSANFVGMLGQADKIVAMASKVFDLIERVSLKEADTDAFVQLFDTALVTGGADLARQAKTALDGVSGTEVNTGYRLSLKTESGPGGSSVDFALDRLVKVEVDAGVFDAEAARSSEIAGVHKSISPGDWSSYAANTRGGFASRVMERSGFDKPMSEVLTYGRPEGIMTRGEMAAIAMKTFGLPATTSSAVVYPFADVSAEDWYEEAALTARAYGIVRGDFDLNTFRGNDSLTVDEAQTVVKNLPEGACPGIVGKGSQYNGKAPHTGADAVGGSIA